MFTRNTARGLSAAATIAAMCGAAHAAEFIVANSGQLSIAMATAVSGDVITILPAGSPYTQFPGFSFANKQLTIRGSTGNPADVVLDGSGLDRVLSISGAGADGTIVRDLTIQNGQGPSANDSSGAGLYINSANVTVEHCVMRNNVEPATDGHGAGLYATQSTLVLRNDRFESNSTGTDGDGAGVYLNGSPTLFEDCVFDGNIAEPTLATSGSGGGAVWIDSAAYQFVRCTFTGNQGEVGGAVYATTSSISTFDACRFDGNTAEFGGGLFVSSAATSSVIRNCVLVNNHCLPNDCPIRADKPLTVTNCTIANNTGGGSYITGSAASNRQVVVVQNSIIWGNTAGSTIGPITSGTNAPIIRRCILQTTYPATNASGDNTVADPLLVNPTGGNYHVQATSPAIDAGDTGLYSGPLADYDVNPRGVDIPGVPDTGVSVFGPVIDIGAYEYQTTPACYANCDQSTTPPVLNVLDFSCFLNRFAAGCP